VPNKGFTTQIGTSPFQLLLRWWLGLPIVPGSQPVECPQCGASADVFGDHFICCSTVACFKRHNHVRDTLASLFREAGFTSVTEVMIGERERPADVAVTGFDERPLAIDQTITHPLKPSEPRDPDTVKKHLLSREERKTSKYIAATARAGWVFTPAAFHPWGGQGPSCSALLERVARKLATPLSGKDRAHCLDSFWQRLSTSLMKGVGDQLILARQVLRAPGDIGQSRVQGRFTGGPCLTTRTNPLTDDFGNLLPGALPVAPPRDGWEPQEGPLNRDEFWIGPLRIRVRPVTPPVDLSD